MTPRRLPPAGPIRITCPACARRWNQIVAADCPVCGGDDWAGEGFLLLGNGALRSYLPEVISRAFTLCLELRASDDMAKQVVDLTAARHNQRAQVQQCRKVGLLAPHHDTNPAPAVAIGVTVSMTHPADITATARTVASSITGLPDNPDSSGRRAVARLAAPPITYDPDNVPVTGYLPGMSVAGYVCFTARVADPIAPLDPRLHAVSRSRVAHQGDSLGRAVFDRSNNR